MSKRKSVCSKAFLGSALGTLLATASHAFAQFAPDQDPERHRTGTYKILRFNDPRDRPKFNERETNRGWEVHRPNFTVVCRTGREDALLAAGEFEAAWNESRRMLDSWTEVHEHPDFGLGAAEVTISDQPPRPLDRDQPETVLTVIGTQMMVYLNLSEDQPPLSEQIPKLRMAAMYSLLHAAHLDRNLPTWVRDGLAVYTAEKLDELNGVKRPADQRIVALDSDYWMRQRVENNRLEERPPPNFEQQSQVRFLLEGYDCKHTLEFFAALKETAEQTPTKYITNKNRRDPEPIAGTAVDELMEKLQSQFKVWRRDPLAGQPLVTRLNGMESDPLLIAAQRELAVVLKLTQRFDQAKVANAIPNVFSNRGVKVSEFRKQPPTAAPTNTAPERSASPAKLTQIIERMTSTATPWATLDADGRVLLSTDQERVQQLLGITSGHLTSAVRENRQVLRMALPNGATLEGWLEENAEKPTRPLAKFTLIRASDAR